MKISRTAVTVLLMGFVLFSNTVEPANTPAAPAPVQDCSSMIMYLVDCMPFVTNNTENSAKGTCCDGLKTVLKTNAFCLCEVFDHSAQLGLKINITKALTLPSVCHLSAPPFSDCELSPNQAPAVAPDVSPAAPPPSSTPSVIPVPGTGNITTPTPTASGASSSSALAFGGLFLVAIVVMSFFSVF